MGKRTQYNREYKREQRARRKAMGLGYIDQEGMSLESYARGCERRKERQKTEHGLMLNKIRIARYKQKMKQLYGGRIDNNMNARVKWLEAKNAKNTCPMGL